MIKDEITRLLIAADSGDGSALDRVLPLVYEELRQLARAHMGRERSNHTLGATALIHEAYLKLVDQDRLRWQSRGHFFAVASMAMRRILVSHARERGRAKRGGGVEKLSLDEGLDVLAPDAGTDLVALDDLLARLEGFDERAARVVECRFFGGLTIEESAEALELSPMTVKRSWRLAKTWLKQQMDQTG